MKSTAERLEQSYCRPTTEADWADVISANPNLPDRPSRFVELNYDLAYIVDGSVLVFGRFDYYKPKMALRKEIKIHQHVDLMHDSIVPWRLEEDGFDMTCLPHKLMITEKSFERHIIEVTENARFVFLNGRLMEGIKTYTDLLEQIRLIG
jgi:hypothetical protein